MCRWYQPFWHTLMCVPSLPLLPGWPDPGITTLPPAACCIAAANTPTRNHTPCRRRSYLLLCGLAGSVSWLALATLVHSPTAAVGAMLLGSLSTACSDVVVDSLVVERARGEPAVRYCTSLYFSSFRLVLCMLPCMLPFVLTARLRLATLASCMSWHILPEPCTRSPRQVRHIRVCACVYLLHMHGLSCRRQPARCSRCAGAAVQLAAS